MGSTDGRAARGALWMVAITAVIGAGSIAGTRKDVPTVADGHALLERLPLSFEPLAERGDFLAHGLREQVVVSSAGVTFRPSAVRRSPIRMRLAGAGSGKLTGAQRLPGKVNRLYGRNEKSWKTGIPTFAQVRQPEAFPGIDVVYYGNQRTLEYDFQVHPGADPSRIRLAFEAGAAPPQVAVEPGGDLTVRAEAGELRLHRPVVYQEAAGQRLPVESAYTVAADGEVSFRLGEYDRSRELVIDPQLTFSTYVSGEGLDSVSGVAVDAGGNVYLTGSTNSEDFAHTNPLQPANAGGFDAFVLKAVPSGGSYTLAYSTFIGGAGSDAGSAVGVDASGYTYVLGVTGSTDFPTRDPLEGQLNRNGVEGFLDAFVLRLTSTGDALLYSTYLGGADDESVTGAGSSLAVTAAGWAYITGTTRSSDFPTTATAYRQTKEGPDDIFVIGLQPDGQDGYSTLLGGLSGSPEEGLGVAVDGQGAVYACGVTQNADFPTTTGALRTTYGGQQDAYVVKLPANLSALTYSTYLGGTSIDQANAIAVDTAGFAYVAGFTGSANYPVTTGAFQTTFHGTAGVDRDACLTKLDRTGKKAVYSTFLGGTGYEIGTNVRVDRLGSVYVAGFAEGAGFPVVAPVQAANAGDSDCFLTRFRNTGGTLAFSTLLGGTSTDRPGGLAVGTDGACYLGGRTTSLDFPLQNAAGGRGENAEGFVSRIADPPVSQGKAVVPKTLKSGTVKVGVVKTKKLKIKNTGKEVLYGMVGLPAAPFAVGNGAGSFALAPKKSLTVEVQFAPTAKGSFTGTLPVWTSDALHVQLSVALSGKGK